MATPSTLSIRQRSLQGTVVAPRVVEDARMLATDLIKGSGSRHTIQQAQTFIQDILGMKTPLTEGYLTVALDVVAHRSHAPLPEPYGFKGGAAREIFSAQAHNRQARPPRDLDLIRRGTFPVPTDREVARTFMPHDYQHGARVELIRSMPRYLSTRDITANEIAMFGATVSLSILGALDTIGHLLRPTRYRGGSIHRQPFLDGRVFLKMVRLYAEAEHHGDPVQLVGIPDEVSFSDFDLALQLDKAFQRNAEVARTFVEALVILGALPASSDPLATLLEELEPLRIGEQGLLPHAPTRDLLT